MQQRTETRLFKILVQLSGCPWNMQILPYTWGTAAKWVRMLGQFRAFEERLVIPAWVKFAEERTEHRFTLFGTDIDVIRPQNFLMEFFIMEKSEG